MATIYDPKLVALVKIVVQEVAEEMLDLLKDLMEEIVYKPSSPSRYRQGFEDEYADMFETDEGRLIDSFGITPAKQVGKYVTAKIFHDPENMDLFPDIYIHGNAYYDDHAGYDSDARKYIADYVIKGAGPWFDEGWWTEPRDFWTPFVAMKKDGTLDKLFKEKFAKYGIQYGL